MEKHRFSNIDEYHALFEPEIRARLEQLRQLIRKVVPTCTEVISYNMPAFNLGKVLVYYAAYKNHIGFYPTAEPIKAFEKELANLPTSKGAIQLLHTEKLPLALIEKVVRYRVKQVKAQE